MTSERLPHKCANKVIPAPIVRIGGHGWLQWGRP